MTSLIFQQWIADWDVAPIREKRKILVLVDNCPAHPNIKSLKNIRLEFLPPSLLDAIYFLARSWRLVKHETITNCFQKSGFGRLAESVEGTDEEPVLPDVTNVDGYLNIDKELQCFEESDSNYDDGIIEGIVSKRKKYYIFFTKYG